MAAAAHIPPDDVIVLAGSSYEGHLGLWRSDVGQHDVNPPVTRSLWVTDDDLRG